MILISEVMKCAYNIVVLVFVVACFISINGTEPTVNCRYRSSYLRQDGASCFEIPPWQQQPVLLEQHLAAIRDRWGNSTSRRRESQLALTNSEITRYMDTVLAPFLDTYHRNIQSSYQQLTGKMLRRIKDEINVAVQKKQEIYAELTQLADELKVPPMCDAERRASRTVASKHVSQAYTCLEEARSSIARMGKYAEEMIEITKSYMQVSMEDIARTFELEQSKTVQKNNVSSCIKELSRAAVALGYELDLSLTNARRHNEQSCERLTLCTNKVRRQTEDTVTELREYLYQCVYA